MNNVVFYLMKDGQIVFHKHTPNKFWVEFFEGKSNKIPDIVVADIDNFFNSREKGLTLENCTECHIIDEETGLEKICYNLSNEELKWETKNKGDINK